MFDFSNLRVSETCKRYSLNVNKSGYPHHSKVKVYLWVQIFIYSEGFGEDYLLTS